MMLVFTFPSLKPYQTLVSHQVFLCHGCFICSIKLCKAVVGAKTDFLSQHKNDVITCSL